MIALPLWTSPSLKICQVLPLFSVTSLQSQFFTLTSSLTGSPPPSCYNPIKTSFLAVVIVPVPFFILTSFFLYVRKGHGSCV